MNWQHTHGILRSEYLKLLPIMALAFYLTFIPHQDYPYALHVDEWTHLANSNQVLESSSVIDLPDPLYGGGSTVNQLFEFGFYLFWAILHQISGIPWMIILRYFPSIVFVIAVLSVYILARRQGFGLEAAFFTTLIPTTVGILGPAFMVPVAMGLVFIPLALFITFNFRGWSSYGLLASLLFFLTSMHIATAGILVIILAPYILLNLKGNFRHSLGITLALAMPFLVALVSFPQMLQDLILPAATSLLSPKPLLSFVQLPRIIPLYGYLPTMFALLGTGILALRSGERNNGLVLGLLALVMVLATFFTLHYGEKFIYYRGLVPAMLMLSIVAGAGLNWVRNITLPAKLTVRPRATFVTNNMGNILCFVLVGIILTIAIPVRQDIPYYRMIDEEDYQAFVWIRDNVGSSYDKAILDPWKATAFTAITGKKVYSRISEYAIGTDKKAYEFLADGSSNTAFLETNRVSMVYSQQGVRNHDLIEVRKNVYLLKKAVESE